MPLTRVSTFVTTNMNTALEQLSEVQQAISARNEADWDNEFCEKLLFCPVAGLLHIEFYGLPFDESFEDFTKALCAPDVANHIRSLVFRGPDEGANGTRNWDFTQLLESEVLFPHLLSVVVEPTLPEHHNHTIIASAYEEEGQIARLLTKMPRLESLTVPSAPDETFFEVGFRPLRYLRVEAGYDTQNFVLNFSQSSGFTKLRVLDFGDFNERYMEDYPAGCTPFEHYKQLFGSKAFSGVVRFLLRNSILSAEQLAELHALKKDCHFMVIQTPPGNYVQ